MDRRRTQICTKCKSNCASFNHFTRKYGSNCLTGVRCVRRRCSHKYFHRRQSPTTAGLPAKLNSTSQASRRSMPGIDYDSAIYVHICRNGVPGRAGGIWEPGLKHKACVFKFLRCEERLWKVPFSWRISVDGRPNRRNKAAFSNFSDVVRTPP